MRMWWAVNLRLRQKGYKPKDEGSYYRVFVKYGNLDKEGVFWFGEDGLYFIGLRSSKFPMTLGWFPREFPYDDPFQPIKKGMTAEEFAYYLKEIGFSEVKDERT